jgi:hypothetical protein
MKKYLLAILLVLSPSLVFAQTSKLTLNWADNSSNEDGFRMQRGTVSTGPFSTLGSTGPSITTFVDLGLPFATQFCYRLQAFSITNPAIDSAFSNVACATTPQPPDTTAPVVAITSPTSSGTFATSSNTVIVGGTASDNVGVTQVSWVNGRGGSGVASGTNPWSVSGIALQVGDNLITVTAKDAAGNVSTVTLMVTYTLPTLVAPSGLTVSGLSGALQFSWSDNAVNESSQKIKWQQSSPPRTGEVTLAANQVSYLMTGVQRGKTRCARVYALAGTFESAPSNQSCGTARR